MIRLYAEFAEVAPLIRGIDELRVRRYERIETYSPYPLPEVERALDAAPSRISVVVFAAGLGAAAGAYALQWLLNGYLYPLSVGGRPPHFPLAFVPITFEMGVLFAGLTVFAAVAWGGRLFRLWHRSREVIGIESATATSYWLEVELPADDVTTISNLLVGLGARAIRREVMP